jgi:hypothetical protein
MEQKNKLKGIFSLVLWLFVIPSYALGQPVPNTYTNLLNVNANWEGLAHEITHTFEPNTEKALVQLHLLNVISYLEHKPVNDLTKQQRNNRRTNIAILKGYCSEGEFPANTFRSNRIPVFIDAKKVHCAVGFLLKANGFGEVAQEIANSQRFSYLKAIQHPALNTWQKTSGLSMFELALIQPTYGPPIYVCASPSPIHWQPLKTEQMHVSGIYSAESANDLYAVTSNNAYQLPQSVKKYSMVANTWSQVGQSVNGQILDVIFCADEIYLSAFLMFEDNPHQLLRLKQGKWEKVAHFNGNVTQMQAFEGKLFVLGDFNLVNNTVLNGMAIIAGEEVLPFKPKGKVNTRFDGMAASETSVFFTSYGSVIQYKNDTIKYLRGIEYYSYLKDISYHAVGDTLFVSAANSQGYTKYYDQMASVVSINNVVYGKGYNGQGIYYTESKQINGQMCVAGDFKAGTLIPQINDERVLVSCDDTASGHWYGEGLLYQYGHLFYPILQKGVVLDFEVINGRIIILDELGNLRVTAVRNIHTAIDSLQQRRG